METPARNDPFKPLLGIVLACGFIALGFYLLQSNDTVYIILGYANIFFFGALLLFGLYKKLTIKK